jgi:hypothetical protein
MKRVLRWYDHLAKCSCYMCGNPRKRKYGGYPTVQEERLLQAARDEARAAS